MNVTYLTEDPARTYAAAVSGAETLPALLKVLRHWQPLVPDALLVAEGMTEEDWPEWRRGLRSERKKKYAGDDWAERFFPIVMPARMMAASSIADAMGVPWGMAYLRCQETGWSKVLA